MTPIDGFIPMLSSNIAHGEVIYHNGATDYFDAINKIEARLNSTPFEMRSKKLEPEMAIDEKPLIRPQHQKYEDILAEHGEKIKQLYEEGKPVPTIRIIMRMSPATVRRVLKDKGVMN